MNGINKKYIAAVLCVLLLFHTMVQNHYIDLGNVKAATNNKYTHAKGFYYTDITTSVKKRINGISYRKNKDISYSDLRYVKVKYINFEGDRKVGELIVNKKIAKDIVEIFYELYKESYPIANMQLIDEYDGDDDASMEANNTTSFNYRPMTGSNKISNHGYGLAIDINPIQNPYVKTKNKVTTVTPPSGKSYTNRSKVKNKKGVITKGDLCYNLFKEHGFEWGGEWNSLKDYQHFEKK